MLQLEFLLLCDEVKIVSFTFKVQNAIYITSLKFITDNEKWQRKIFSVMFCHSQYGIV